MAKRKKRLRASSKGEGAISREEETTDADGMLWRQEVQVRVAIPSVSKRRALESQNQISPKRLCMYHS
eukprot:7628849-Ditylum_brightwellii.AAC.1